MNRVRVNHVQESTRDGHPVFVKRRRTGGQIVIWLANRLFAFADGGICMFVRAGEWIDWEMHCSALLYPERPKPEAGSRQTLIVPKVNGISLRQLLHRESADVGKAFVLAARELRRVHRVYCDRYKAGWSHGDLHLDNILCDLTTERAALIDFDMRHEFGIGDTQRHSDDLKLVLLELAGWSDDKWRDLATAFLQEYSDASVLNELHRQLFVPRGLARLLMYSRTNSLSLRSIEPRLQALRDVIRRVLG